MTEHPTDSEVERRLATLYSDIEREELPSGLANLTAKDFTAEHLSRFRPIVLGSIAVATAVSLAIVGIVVHNTLFPGAPATGPARTSAAPSYPTVPILPATTATAHPAPSLTAGVASAELLAVAEATMSPTGSLCDTHRDMAPSDVNSCPYTQRLKSFVDGLYQRAFAGQGNPNPVLSAGAGSCTPTVGYEVTATDSGGTVALKTGCSGDAATPPYQKLVMVDVGGGFLVDDILLDPRHNGTFVSIYAMPSG
jgi:hypothetical protein